MYIGGSVVGVASTIAQRVRPLLPEFLQRVKKRNLALFSTSFNFEAPAFEIAAIYLNSETKS